MNDCAMTAVEAIWLEFHNYVRWGDKLPRKIPQNKKS